MHSLVQYSVTMNRWMNRTQVGIGVHVYTLLDWSHKGHSTFFSSLFLSFCLSLRLLLLPFTRSHFFPTFYSSVSMHCDSVKWIEHWLFSIDCSERCPCSYICIYLSMCTVLLHIWQESNVSNNRSIFIKCRPWSTSVKISQTTNDNNPWWKGVQAIFCMEKACKMFHQDDEGDGYRSWIEWRTWCWWWYFLLFVSLKNCFFDEYCFDLTVEVIWR